MSTVIQTWLQGLFAHAQDVRRASTRPDPAVITPTRPSDLVIETWMGARLYVHLITQAPKIAHIKQILRDNTRNNVGTLFLIHADLVPAHGEAFKLRDWLAALAELNHQTWVYAYKAHAAGFSLCQVQCVPTPAGTRHVAWHVDDFPIESVAARKRDVQAHLRGTYLVGDIASQTFRRRVNYERVHQTFHYRTRTKQTPNHPQTSSETLERCYDLLGVKRGSDQATVKAGYRKMALQLHPDVSALPRSEAERRFKEVSEAYEMLKRHHQWT